MNNANRSTRPRGLPHRLRARRGFTIVEAVLSLLIVSIMFVAALSVTANSQANQQLTADHSLGMLLADQLMMEILGQAYKAPNASVTLGKEGGEQSNNRSSWNDVDDYDGWQSSPPENKSGVFLTGFGSDWNRSVEVDYVSPSNLNLVVSNVNTGVKRITVTVKHRDRIVAQLSALRTGAADDSAEYVSPVKLDATPIVSYTGQLLEIQ